MPLTKELEELIAFLAPLVEEEKKANDEVKATTPEQWRSLADNLLDARKALADARAALGVAAATAKQDRNDQTDRALRFETGVESAGDREQWVEELHDRALVYARRATPAATTAREAALLKKAQAEAAAAEAEAKAEKARLKEADNLRKAAAADRRASEHEARQAQLEERRSALVVVEQQLGRAAAEGEDVTILTEKRKELQRGIEQLVEATTEEVEAPTTAKTGWALARSKLVAAQSGVETARGKLGSRTTHDALTSSFTQDLDLEAEMILVLRRRLEGVARHG